MHKGALLAGMQAQRAPSVSHTTLAAGEDMDKYGHLRVRDLLSRQSTPDPCKGVPTVLQCNSIPVRPAFLKLAA